MNKRSLSLKYEYNLSDLLSWVYHNNPAFFEVLVENTPPERIWRELCTNFYHAKYRNVLLKAAGIRNGPRNNQSRINQAFVKVADQCHANLDEQTRAWYHQRGITDEQIARHKLGTSRGYNPLKALSDSVGHEDRITKPIVECSTLCFFYPPLCGMDEVVKHFGKSEMVFATVPFVDSTGVSNLCCRVLDDDYTEVLKFFFSHGPTALFNLDKIDTSRYFYVFEGVFDTLAAERHGIASVALGCSSLSEEQAKLLEPFRETAILCLDGDIAGRNGMEKSDLRKYFLPDGGDPEDFLKDSFFAYVLRDNLLDC